MLNRRKEIVASLLPSDSHTIDDPATAFAPVNIALVKYWGKRDEALHLPVTDSFSVALSVGTTTTISKGDHQDIVELNGARVPNSSPFFQRLSQFLDLFRPSPSFRFHVVTHNDIPTAAGLASSSSGFAALCLALNHFFQWNLPPESLSCLARLGSGSACRSIYPGFVLWQKGSRDDGKDSYAIPSPFSWPDLRFGILMASSSEKPISSSHAMKLTRETSPLYSLWPQVVEHDLKELLESLETKEFSRFGTALERNALTMHATMHTSTPPICYWLEETVRYLHTVWDARAQNIPVYATMDAGPNVKIFFLASDEIQVRALFPQMIEVPLYTHPTSEIETTGVIIQ
jgi:diphosphomevalonate decarboxylase